MKPNKWWRTKIDVPGRKWICRQRAPARMVITIGALAFLASVVFLPWNSYRMDPLMKQAFFGLKYDPPISYKSFWQRNGPLSDGSIRLAGDGSLDRLALGRLALEWICISAFVVSGLYVVGAFNAPPETDTGHVHDHERSGAAPFSEGNT